MNHHHNSRRYEFDDATPHKGENDHGILEELVTVLSPYPGGRHRWAVMRAIRDVRERASREIPLKFEDEIERVFRRFCSKSTDGRHLGCAPDTALFHRPGDRAGEVWALHADSAKVWLAQNTAEFG